MGMTGNLGGGSSWVVSGGVIHPFLTASARRESVRTGLRLGRGGISSATTLSPSVTRIVSPEAASRTYSLMFVLEYLETYSSHEEKVASRSYLCQTPSSIFGRTETC